MSDYRTTCVPRLPLKPEQSEMDTVRKHSGPVGPCQGGAPSASLEPAERTRILETWNRTEHPFEASCLHEPFEAQVRANPSAVALEVDATRVTYRQLHERAQAIAAGIVLAGGAPGRTLGVFLSRGVDLVATLLAASRCGMPYVPIDPAYPSERVRFMLDDAAVVLTVTTDALAARLAGKCLAVERLDQRTHDDAAVLLPSGDPARPCYVIYTSGSTGQPKGVVMSHRAVANTLQWVNRTFEVGPGDRILWVTPAGFDLSVYDLFGGLGAGATIVIATDAQLANPGALVEQLTAGRITVWNSAPALLQALRPFFPRGSDGSLRLVMLSGDWIPVSLPDAVRAAFPSARVVSLGGATEAAIWSNWFEVGAVDPEWRSIPYGRPIQNCRYHVLDANMQPVPVGTRGELYIGGACLAEGYLNRPRQTAERFVDDPFRPGERLFRTGDLARYLADGNLEFLGRNDLQAKIRGFRVELGEVDSALEAIEGVRAARVTTHEDASGQRALAAYVVREAGADLEASDIRRALAATLPEYMIPSRFTWLDRLPLSTNGKVDRAQLEGLGQRARDASRGTVPARTLEEAQMLAIWRQVLDTDGIGVTDDFFALGGHSLVAIRMMTYVEQVFGVSLPVPSVMSHPTVERLTRLVTEHDFARRHLVTLSSEGSGPPVILIAGIGGYGFVFDGIARTLSGQHPVHVLNAVGTEGLRLPEALTIPQIARIYARQVEEACPFGPLVLGGYSFGATVAYELSRQLQRAGREVEMLISIDGFAPGHPRRLPLLVRLQGKASNLQGLDRKTQLRRIARKVKRLSSRPAPAPAPEAAARRGIDAKTARLLQRIGQTLRDARKRYHPRGRIATPMLLVRAPEETYPVDTVIDPLYGWQTLTDGPIHACDVPGKHLQLFDRDNAPAVARAIATALAALADRPAGPARLR